MKKRKTDFPRNTKVGMEIQRYKTIDRYSHKLDK